LDLGMDKQDGEKMNTYYLNEWKLVIDETVARKSYDELQYNLDWAIERLVHYDEARDFWVDKLVGINGGIKCTEELEWIKHLTGSINKLEYLIKKLHEKIVYRKITR
jgi:hypothetical protein